ncbi:hypothetical protein GPJ56_006595 [Histomonas meleagridis]|uniref:uncharacterized protein n=1 Tax=Histomonas meleagridis TaxID=135588 RepID=UPI00355A2629|nr:hypothetical protein GPJ56_006595 [Histomonas meleagridis]KAH0798427.1 hypothetical protein GO595_008819 [Histomonas meleagridis]
MSLFEIQFRAKAFRNCFNGGSVGPANDHIRVLREQMDKYRDSNKPNFEAAEWKLGEETLRFYEEVKDLMDLIAPFKSYTSVISFVKSERLGEKMKNVKERSIPNSFLRDYKGRCENAVEKWNPNFVKLTSADNYKETIEAHEICEQFLEHYDEYVMYDQVEDFARNIGSTLDKQLRELEDWTKRNAQVRIMDTWADLKSTMEKITSHPHSDLLLEKPRIKALLPKYKSFHETLEGGAIEDMQVNQEAQTMVHWISAPLDKYRLYVKAKHSDCDSFRDVVAEQIENIRQKNPKVLETPTIKTVIEEFEKLKEEQFNNDLIIWKTNKISYFQNKMEEFIREYRDAQSNSDTSFLIDGILRNGEEFMEKYGGRSKIYWEKYPDIFLDFANDPDTGCKELVDEWNQIIDSHSGYVDEVNERKRREKLSIEEADAISDLKKAIDASVDIRSDIGFPRIENALRYAKEKNYELASDELDNLIRKCEDEVIPIIRDRIRYVEMEREMNDGFNSINQYISTGNIGMARDLLEKVRYIVDDISFLKNEEAKDTYEMASSKLQDLDDRISEITHQSEAQVNESLENLKSSIPSTSSPSPEPTPAPTPAPMPTSTPAPAPAPQPAAAPTPQPETPPPAASSPQQPQQQIPAASVQAAGESWRPCTEFTLPREVMNSLSKQGQWAVNEWLKYVKIFNNMANQVDIFIDSIYNNRLKSELSPSNIVQWKQSIESNRYYLPKEILPRISDEETKEILTKAGVYDIMIEELKLKFGLRLNQLLSDAQDLYQYMSDFMDRDKYTKLIKVFPTVISIFTQYLRNVEDVIRSYDIFDVPPVPHLESDIRKMATSTQQILRQAGYSNSVYRYTVDETSINGFNAYNFAYALDQVLSNIRKDTRKFSMFPKMKPYFDDLHQKVEELQKQIFKVWFDAFERYAPLKPERGTLNSLLSYTRLIKGFEPQYTERALALEKLIKENAAANNAKIDQLIKEWNEARENEHQERVKVVMDQIIKPIASGGKVTINGKEFTYDLSGRTTIIFRAVSGPDLYKVEFKDTADAKCEKWGFFCSSNADENHYATRLCPLGFYSIFIDKKPLILDRPQDWEKDIIYQSADLVNEVKVNVDEVNYNNVQDPSGKLNKVIRALVSFHESNRDKIMRMSANALDAKEKLNNLFNIKNNSATQPNGLETGVIEASLPFAELAPLKKEDTINVKYSTLHFALLNISMNLYPDIIAGIFPPTNTTQPFEDYLKIKSQWQLITKSEWQHNCNMRIFVHDLEHWLGVRSKQHTEEYNRLFFNVSLTLFFSCFCELKFSEIFATFLEILCFTFIRKKQDKTAFYDSSGKLLTSDEAENWVFWRIKGLWRKITNIQTSELNDSLAIRSILLNISPPTLEMLNERNITSLSFATRNCVYQMFVKGRPKQDALLLVTAALASEDLVKFRQYAIAVALVLLQGKLEDLPNGDFELFSQMYTTEVQKINPRVLLYNVEKMFASFSE